MRYRVEHVTRVEYKAQARMARFNLRLQPACWPGQEVDGFELAVDPQPSSSAGREGQFPFHVTELGVEQPFDRLEIRVRFDATAEEPMLDLVSPDPAIREVASAAMLSDDLGPWSPVHYVYPSQLLPGTPAIEDWAAEHLPPHAPAFASGLALTNLIKAEFKYDGDATEADTPVAQAFRIRRGVCQDFAHVLIEAFRSAGLPAAYVSGYLRTIPPPGKPRLVGVDAMHAWVALWCGPQRGWIGLDPTNGCVAGSGHIVTGMGRDYADVSPIDGIFVGGGSQKIESVVDVIPLD
jgi:transglutaminase-like putative cysteine protease